MGPCHHSLVTPIDWKPKESVGAQQHVVVGHHSLVTPIDWKRVFSGAQRAQAEGCHHSLVTPIDWKLVRPFLDEPLPPQVTTRW